MRDTNNVVLTGRLTKDIDVKYSGATAIGNISIANNYSKKVGTEYKDDANYFNATVFGKQCEGLQPYLKKGTQVVITGELRQERWEKDGQKNSRVNIIVSNIQLVGGHSDGAKKDNGNYQNGYTQTQDNFAKGQDFHGEDFPEDVPF